MTTKETPTQNVRALLDDIAATVDRLKEALDGVTPGSADAMLLSVELSLTDLHDSLDRIEDRLRKKVD
jgi:hypothetical protein